MLMRFSLLTGLLVTAACGSDVDGGATSSGGSTGGTSSGGAASTNTASGSSASSTVDPDGSASSGGGSAATDDSGSGASSNGGSETSGASGPDDDSGSGGETEGPVCSSDPGQIGDACTDASDCTATPGEPFCQGGFWEGGYCLDGTGGAASNCDVSDPIGSCPPCTVCTTLPFFNAARCVRACTGDEECREGYLCQPTDDPELFWCAPPF